MIVDSSGGFLQVAVCSVILGICTLAFQAPGSAMLASHRNTAAMRFYTDTSLSQDERTAGLLRYLIAEVVDPSQPVMGLGGMITSDYVQSNILIALKHVATLEVLDRVAPTQATPEVTLVIDMARAYLGDRGAAPAALQVLETSPGPFLRRSAIQALSDLRVAEAIPALKQALSDPYSFEVVEGPMAPGWERNYPVRAAAALALKQFGVRVLEVAPYVYQILGEERASLGEPALEAPGTRAAGIPDPRLLETWDARRASVGAARQAAVPPAGKVRMLLICIEQELADPIPADLPHWPSDFTLSEMIQMRAMQGLAEIQDRGVLADAYAEVKGDPELGLRVLLGLALGGDTGLGDGDSSALQACLGLLSSPGSDFLRSRGTRGLGEIALKHPETLPQVEGPLRTALSDASSRPSQACYGDYTTVYLVRLEARSALLRLGLPVGPDEGTPYSQ